MIFVADILSRIGHMRGFGIQSPWAYSFVREVIAERWPYYAYEKIDSRLDGAPKRFIRKVKLYFRIVNRIQPDVLIDMTGMDFLIGPLALLGCRKSVQKYNLVDGALTVVRMNYDQKNDITYVYNKVKDGSVIIVERINKGLRFKVDGLWPGAVVFDLIDTAIIYKDRKMNKAVYKLNF